jgi:hypothetical protein
VIVGDGNVYRDEILRFQNGMLECDGNNKVNKLAKELEN